MRKFNVIVSTAAIALTTSGAAQAWGNLFNNLLSSTVQQAVAPQTTGEAGDNTGVVGSIAGAALQQTLVGGNSNGLGGNSAKAVGVNLLVGAALAGNAQADADAGNPSAEASVAPASVESEVAGAALGGMLRGLFGR